MNRFRSAAFLAVLTAALWSPSCAPESGMGAERAPVREVVTVASAPAELIALVTLGAEQVERLGADASAVGWSPDDAELASLVTARRVLLMGAEFEPWAQRAGLPPSRTITLADGLGRGTFIAAATVSHTHGKGPAHSHGGTVPTTWTDPALLRAMMHGAGELLAGVLRTPERTGDAEAAVERHVAFGQELEAYEDALAELKTRLEGRRIFAAAHGLEYIARAVEAPLLVTLLEIGAKGERDDHAATLLEQAAGEPGHAGVLVWLGPVDVSFAKLAEEELGLASVTLDIGLGGAGDALMGRMTAGIRELAAAVR